ncbi:MAG: GTP-binding protein [Rhizobiales bacterium]|nr:GTP-binding protein [Hyphomicrobiales bacterium]
MAESNLRDTVTTVSIITGFLGSGKTTLMRNLLRDPVMKNAVVIVNEFGEIGLDHQLMDIDGQNVVLLESGCICCSLDGSLVETLETLHQRRRAGRIPSFERVLIETTGIADPAPLIHELFDNRAVRLGVKLDRIITLVDAASGWATLDRHDISVRQVALANSILVSKADLVPPEAVAQLTARLTAINPSAPILRSDNGVTEVGALFDDRHDMMFGDIPVRLAPKDRTPHAHDHHHHDRISTEAIRFIDPLPLDGFNTWLEQTIAAYGDDLLRIKGILNIEGRSRPVVIHGVQRVFHPAVELDSWPDADRSSRLVFILHDISGNDLIRSLRRAVAPHDTAPVTARMSATSSPYPS